ncbi:MAG: hypothetical protein KF729_09305 [Sandaracinaceae bacterium]|nr:hypothetical protein [Sandaracinaceae bacterium]
MRRRLFVLASLLFAVATFDPRAAAQAPRPPRVQVTHERGPIMARTLELAWPGRAFARCQAETSDDVVHLHVRVEADATVVIEHGLLGAPTPAERCVVEVITAARFPPQTEPTQAHVTVYLRPAMSAPPLQRS